MTRRWCAYLVVLGLSLGLYGASPGWMTWIITLTVAGSPLVSVAVSAFLGEKDALGLFRFPGKKRLAYDHRLRPYRPGDSPSRVHWKKKAKAGGLLIREEQVQALPKKKRISGIVPVALCFGILFFAFPPGQYPRQMLLLRGFFQPKPEVRFDLTAGPRTENRQAVMDVVASQSQLLYLRGQAFEIYDGQNWQAENLEEWSVWEPEGTVTVAARPPQDMTFVPYDGIKEKPSKRCLQLPGETKTWAAALAAGKTAEEIQEFIRSCANYDENTEAMPENADFARWFIENGRGYCVHFATAAVVLLRSAGIPARFVTGYVVPVQAGLRKTVVGSDAHTWAEYWDGECWRILEATPAVEAAPLPQMPGNEENRRSYGGVWVLLLAATALCCKKRKKENGRLKELRQKAAFSRDGLNDEEKRELEVLLAAKGLLHILFFLRKAKAERKGKKLKQEEKKPIPWEVADPKPPVVRSGKMGNRKQN